MKKKYLKLTKDQKARGVIFSSALIPTPSSGLDIRVHEVTLKEWQENATKAQERIDRLKKDKFFDMPFYQYNLIRS